MRWMKLEPIIQSEVSQKEKHQYSILTHAAAATAAKSLQSCPTLCDPIDGSPPGSPVPGILQARTLEWVAIAFSDAWKRKVKVKLLSRVRLLVTPWTAAHQAPPSMGFPRQGYWSGVPSDKCPPLSSRPHLERLERAIQLGVNEVFGKLTTRFHDARSLCGHYLPGMNSEFSSEKCLSGWPC